MASIACWHVAGLLLDHYADWAGRGHSLDKPVYDGRGRSGVRPWKNWCSGMKRILGKRWLPALILLISLISYVHRASERPRFLASQNVEHKFWSTAPSLGWRSSCAHRSSDWIPPRKSNGYLVVRCIGSLSQQRIAIGNAVLAARIMNATLVLPQLDNLFWHDESGFPGIYDVDHFITTLKNDIRVVRSLPTMWAQEATRTRLKPFQLHPPQHPSVEWYETTALEKMKEHGALYLNPFYPHLEEGLDNQEYQRLRCRVSYHALRFTHDVSSLSSLMVERLRSEGPYMAIHLGFQEDKQEYLSNLTEKEAQEQHSDAEKELESSQGQMSGASPLTPKEVGLFLRALGFDNSTRIYLATGKTDTGDKSFLDPLRAIFPYLENRSTVALPEELDLVRAEGGYSLLGLAVDYMVSLLSDIFIPTYDDPSEFANSLIGQRLYYGFRTTLQPDGKSLATFFADLENERLEIPDFETSVRKVMNGRPSGGPHARIPPESFYTNPWPECFCLRTLPDGAYQCPLKTTTWSLSYDEDQDDNYAGWNA